MGRPLLPSTFASHDGCSNNGGDIFGPIDRLIDQLIGLVSVQMTKAKL